MGLNSVIVGCHDTIYALCHFNRVRETTGLSQLSSRWLESCDLRIGQAEAGFLGGEPGGGSVSFTVTLTDKDVRGGDECISSLEVVVTPGSLAERESSILWHRLFSQV